MRSMSGFLFCKENHFHFNSSCNIWHFRLVSSFHWVCVSPMSQAAAAAWQMGAHCGNRLKGLGTSFSHVNSIHIKWWFVYLTLRGVVFSALATAWISWALHRDRSVPLGKYCRRRPFVFSFVPRCHGLRGSAKKTFTPDSIVNRAWSDSSLPRSQVNDCFRWAGRVVTVFLSALAMVTAP